MISFKQFFKEALQMINGKLSYAPRDQKGRMDKFKADMLAGNESGSDENIIKKLSSNRSSTSKKFWINRQSVVVPVIGYGTFHENYIPDKDSLNLGRGIGGELINGKTAIANGCLRAWTEGDVLKCENKVKTSAEVARSEDIKNSFAKRGMVFDDIIINTKDSAASKSNYKPTSTPKPGVVDLSEYM